MSGIQGSELLTDVFGYWPSFHDAEVISVNLDRLGRNQYYGPTIVANVHVFEMPSEVSERGAYVLRHHTLVALQFCEVDSFRADGLNHQNALWGLSITDLSNRQLEDVKFQVQFSSSFGLEMEFVCKGVMVLSAAPFVPPL